MSNARLRNLKDKVRKALDGGAAPSKMLANTLRHECGEGHWLDITYIKVNRPELIGDDDDGMIDLSENCKFLKDALASLDPLDREGIIKGIEISKGLVPLHDSGGRF